MAPLNLRTIVVLLVLAGSLAGCVDPGSVLDGGGLEAAKAGAPVTGASATGASGAASASTGDVRVVAHDRELAPLADATVTVVNRTATTGADGVAKLRGLPPGMHEIVVEKSGYRAARVGVDVVAGAEAYVEATLADGDAVAEAPVAGEHGGHVDARQVYEFVGYFDCSATYVIITGDCLVLVDNATATAGVPTPVGDSTNEVYTFDFPLDLGWKSAVLELEWSESATTVGSGMSLSLEPAEAPADGHAARYARVEGESLLRMQLDAGAKHETATAEDMPNPLGGELVRARAYVLGEADSPGGTSFLGVGAAAGQRFTLYVTVFYDEVAPASYSVKEAA